MTTTHRDYCFGSRLATDIETARPLVEAALKAEGFGVLTEIDVRATMRAKLGVDVPPYLILGACNPRLAHGAIEADPSVGTLLPCNVVLRAEDDATVLEIMDPEAALGLVGVAGIADVATEAATRLHRVMQAVEASVAAGGAERPG
jgi:uncharacterized protein (DUF302 family)